eukprot:711461-Hanusia_phi.AAC.1
MQIAKQRTAKSDRPGQEEAKSEGERGEREEMKRRSQTEQEKDGREIEEEPGRAGQRLEDTGAGRRTHGQASRA